jgi:hypothetical protein
MNINNDYIHGKNSSNKCLKKMITVDYKNNIRQCIKDPTEMYFDGKSMNIFMKPVEKLFFWKNDIDDTFFVLFRYNDIFFSLRDRRGEIYQLLDEHVDDETFYEIILYLMNTITIYKSFDDIKFTKYDNELLVQEFQDYYDLIFNM